MNNLIDLEFVKEVAGNLLATDKDNLIIRRRFRSYSSSLMPGDLSISFPDGVVGFLLNFEVLNSGLESPYLSFSYSSPSADIPCFSIWEKELGSPPIDVFQFFNRVESGSYDLCWFNYLEITRK